MAGRYDITIDQGATWSEPIAWTADGVLVDTAAYTARMQVRSAVADSTALLELTTENARISVGKLSEGTDDQSNVRLTLTPTATNSLDDWGKAVYDLEVVDAAGTVTRLLEGYIFLSMNVTR